MRKSLRPILLALLLGCSPEGDLGHEAAVHKAPAEVAPIAPRRLKPGPPEALASGLEQVTLGYRSDVNSLVAGFDLDRDGRDEAVVAGVRELAVIRWQDGRPAVIWRSEPPGGATALVTGDVDGDGFEDLVVGWGRHRENLAAPATLIAYRTAGASPGSLLVDEIARPRTTRAQFTQLSVTALEAGGRRGVLYAHFASKYDVRGAFVRLVEGVWEERELHVMRMAAQLLAVGDRLVIGRPYGDELKTEGDVFVAGEERRPLASVRGVRSLALLDVGPADARRTLLCYGDGWHWRYRDEGRGILTCAPADASGGLEAQPIGEVSDYSLGALASGDVDGDGVDGILALGVDALHAFDPVTGPDGALGWKQRAIGPGGYAFAVLDVDGDGRDEVLLAGEEPTLLRRPGRAQSGSLGSSGDP